MPTTTTDRLYTTRAESRSERVFLAAVETDDADALWSVDDSLAELASLATTAGAEVIGSLVQRLRMPDRATYLGKGRAHELAQICQARDIDLIIVDDELAPSQQRNLEELTDVRVIDRTALILDIFAQHAHTREGQLQVELAQLEYRLPRLTGFGRALSRVGGGSRGSGGGGVGGAIGVRGPGETKLEIDRRRIRTRIATLRRELEMVRRQRTVHRRARGGAMPVVAVVGYTNAGKSTLFNAITSAGVLVENKLFATLDPTTRHVTLPTHQEVLMTDTVGFIQKLPTSLVAAFRATLEEVIEADMLLEVVDITHPNALEQSETVSAVLEELGAGDKPRVTALNKIDLLESLSEIDSSVYPNAVPVSALRGQNLRELLTHVGDVLTAMMVPVRIKLPFERGDLLDTFHRRGRIGLERQEMDGTVLDGALPHALLGMFAPYRIDRRTGRHGPRTRESAAASVE